MVIVKLMGGLGNQMFQYAAARSISLRHGTDLKLDLSFLDGEQTGDTPRAFALDCFAINAEKASRWDIVSMGGKGTKLLETVTAKFFQLFRGNLVYREKQFNLDSKFFLLSGNVYLEGYWQSERYFADFEDVIRKELTVKIPIYGENLELAKEILGVNAVSLHVRRGDYVADEKIKAKHYVCDLLYYRSAEEMLMQSIENPSFFVFSDDPQWAETNLKLSRPARYVKHNNMAYEDLRLMSLCRHHIIANSSFSWWGAWLSVHPGKLVIAPRKWFNDPSINTNDLIPSGWWRL
jgi:hypothetical protein